MPGTADNPKAPEYAERPFEQLAGRQPGTLSEKECLK
jgi:hypothetical protein